MKFLLTSISSEVSTMAFPLGVSILKTTLDNEFPKELLETKIIQFYLSESSEKNILDQILSAEPDAIGLSIYIWNRSEIVTLTKELKRLRPEIILIGGGAEATANPGSLMKDSVLDYIILGDGEVVLPGVTGSILKGEDPGPKAGLISRKTSSLNTVPVYNTRPGETPSSFLSKTLDIGLFPGILWETSRGCPYNCSFCYESKGRDKTATYPYDRLAGELQFFSENDICQIFVLDPSFNSNKKHALKILELIKEHCPEIQFTFEIKGEELDEELARSFGEINCYLQIGLQSSNPTALKNVNRFFNEKKFTAGCNSLHNNGVPFGLDLIYGIPGDSYTYFLKSMDFALSQKPQNLDIFPLAVLPGTPLAERAEEFGMDYNRKSPYLIIALPGFPEEDIALAEVLTESADAFLSGGETQYWFTTIVKASGLTPSDFLSGYYEWIKKSENNDFKPEKLREQYTEKTLLSTGNKAAIKAAMSLMRLYGAINDILEGSDTAIAEIYFNPDDLENAEMVNLSDFSTYFDERLQYWLVYQEEGELLFAEIVKPT
ncbi:MAG: radical SAM protein [Spirochaetales bacterium]|nr:radical SAM protein [Spirochaetales bacterium]